MPLDPVAVEPSATVPSAVVPSPTVPSAVVPSDAVGAVEVEFAPVPLALVALDDADDVVEVVGAAVVIPEADVDDRPLQLDAPGVAKA